MNAPLPSETDSARAERLEHMRIDALVALDERRWGDLRRILRTGSAPSLKTQTGVIAKDCGR